MEKKDKSILDGMPTKEQGFPLGGTAVKQTLEIIGMCPVCHSPIYGPRMIAANESPVIKHTCAC